jgi:hypothetical protein
MDFDFTDSRNWKYHFHIDEEDLLFIDFIVEMGPNGGTCKSAIAFLDEVFLWSNHPSLFSEEAKEFCEKKVTAFMKMKAFW